MRECIDVCVSFDTTGSMYPCFTQVRLYIGEMMGQLFKDMPNLRIAIITHGGYCDKGNSCEDSLIPVSEGRFQELDVDKETNIKAFVFEQETNFKVDLGFYESTKSEKVGRLKEILLAEKETYKVLIQSTSYSRNLMAHTSLLDEVEKRDREGEMCL